MTEKELYRKMEAMELADVGEVVQGFVPGETLEGVTEGFLVEATSRGIACGPVSTTMFYHVGTPAQAEMYAAVFLVFDRDFGGSAGDADVERVSLAFMEAYGDAGAMARALSAPRLAHDVAVHDVKALLADERALVKAFGFMVEEAREDGKDVFDLGNYRAMDV